MTRHLRSTAAAIAAATLVLAGCTTEDDPEPDTIVEDTTDGDEEMENGEEDTIVEDTTGGDEEGEEGEEDAEG
jgi:hypothetical protein